MNATDRLTKQRPDAHRLDLLALGRLLRELNGVGHHHLFERRLVRDRPPGPRARRASHRQRPIALPCPSTHVPRCRACPPYRSSRRRSQSLPVTSPMRCMTSLTFARSRRLSIMAEPRIDTLRNTHAHVRHHPHRARRTRRCDRTCIANTRRAARASQRGCRTGC